MSDGMIHRTGTESLHSWRNPINQVISELRASVNQETTTGRINENCSASSVLIKFGLLLLGNGCLANLFRALHWATLLFLFVRLTGSSRDYQWGYIHTGSPLRQDKMASSDVKKRRGVSARKDKLER